MPSNLQIFGTISAFEIFPGTLFSAPSKLALSYSNWPKSKTADTQRHIASIYPALNPNARIVASISFQPSTSCFSVKSPPVFK